VAQVEARRVEDPCSNRGRGDNFSLKLNSIGPAIPFVKKPNFH
jgi:hypothetical protein